MSDTEAQKMEPQTVSKITAKLLGNPRKGAAAEPGEGFLLGTILGAATGSKVKTMPNGDAFEGVNGDFEAVSADGQVYRSGVLYLPGGIHEQLLSAVKQAEGAAVKFALELRTYPDTNAAGYSYRATTIQESRKVDPLAELRAAVAARRGGRPVLANAGKVVDAVAEEVAPIEGVASGDAPQPEPGNDDGEAAGDAAVPAKARKRA